MLSSTAGWAVGPLAGDPGEEESTRMELRPRGARSREGQNKQGGWKEEQTLLAGKPNQVLEPNRPEVVQTLHAGGTIFRLHLSWSVFVFFLFFTPVKPTTSAHTARPFVRK